MFSMCACRGGASRGKKEEEALNSLKALMSLYNISLTKVSKK